MTGTSSGGVTGESCTKTIASSGGVTGEGSRAWQCASSASSVLPLCSFPLSPRYRRCPFIPARMETLVCSDGSRPASTTQHRAPPSQHARLPAAAAARQSLRPSAVVRPGTQGTPLDRGISITTPRHVACIQDGLALSLSPSVFVCLQDGRVIFLYISLFPASKMTWA